MIFYVGIKVFKTEGTWRLECDDDKKQLIALVKQLDSLGECREFKTQDKELLRKRFENINP
jgi:hypothetical protein